MLVTSCLCLQNYIVSTVGSGFCVYDVNTGTLLVEKLNAHYSKILHIEFVFSGWVTWEQLYTPVETKSYGWMTTVASSVKLSNILDLKDKGHLNCKQLKQWVSKQVFVTVMLRYAKLTTIISLDVQHSTFLDSRLPATNHYIIHSKAADTLSLKQLQRCTL